MSRSVLKTSVCLFRMQDQNLCPSLPTSQTPPRHTGPYLSVSSVCLSVPVSSVCLPACCCLPLYIYVSFVGFIACLPACLSVSSMYLPAYLSALPACLSFLSLPHCLYLHNNLIYIYVLGYETSTWGNSTVHKYGNRCTIKCVLCLVLHAYFSGTFSVLI